MVGDARAGAEERVQVYATMYRLRVAEALESQFPRVARALGAGRVRRSGRRFRGRQSRRAIRRCAGLGRGFPDWLAGNRARACRSWSPLARLEWARADVFDLADQPALTVEALRALPPDAFAELPLRLIDAHRFVDAGRADAGAVGRAARGRPGRPGRGRAADGRGGTLVWRQDVAVYHRGLGADERAALESVAAGTTFGLVCERLAAGRTDEEAAARAFGWLSTWALDGPAGAPAGPDRPCRAAAAFQIGNQRNS